MSDVSNKDEILHRATSQSIIRVYPETLERVKNNKSFEVNIIESAKISATLAAKKSWEIIPHSHQKTIDHVRVDISIRSELIEIIVEVKGLSKSSLVIESLTAASAAAITIYDKLRSLGDSVSIESIRLLRESDVVLESKEKRGKKVKAAVLVIGNSELLQEKEDQMQKFTVDKLSKNDFEVIESNVIDTKHNLIESNLKRLCDETKVNLVITCGGIEFKSENIVSDITEKLLDKKIEGIPEMLRSYGVKRIPSAILYRGVAGIRDKSVIINLPGNIKEISESLDMLFPYLLHINKIIERN
jgi:molybdenum cofactor biosynthesis protein MoaC